MKKFLPFFLTAALLAVAPGAHAWSEGGHRVTGVIAARLLDVPTRDAAIVLLKEHPFFSRDFAAKPEGADEAEWLFSQAAVWPDLVRTHETLHHGSWHYINLPFMMPGAETIEWQQNISREWEPGMDAGSLNIMQAIAKAKAEVGDVAIPAADRAIALCWLLHLIGDIHQPLHAIALVTPVRFAEGDRGGNGIEIARGGSLHSYWDALAGGNGFPWRKVQERADNLMNWADFRISAERAAKELDPETWLQESFKVAGEYAYTIGVREHVLRSEAQAVLPPKELNYQYKFQARDAAYTRAAQAGYRMAAVLQQLF
jgi:hypothetical protein